MKIMKICGIPAKGRLKMQEWKMQERKYWHEAVEKGGGTSANDVSSVVAQVARRRPTQKQCAANQHDVLLHVARITYM